MRNTFSYQFYCRESKASKKAPHYSPVELGFSVNGKRVFINLPFKCSAKDFNRKKRPQHIEDYLNTQRMVINKVLTDMADKGIPLTASNLRLYFREGGVRSYTALDMFNEYLAILKQRVPSTLTKGVYRKYELVRDLFFENFDRNQECTAITNAVIRKFFAILDDRYQSATASEYEDNPIVLLVHPKGRPHSGNQHRYVLTFALIRLYYSNLYEVITWEPSPPCS